MKKNADRRACVSFQKVKVYAKWLRWVSSADLWLAALLAWMIPLRTIVSRVEVASRTSGSASAFVLAVNAFFNVLLIVDLPARLRVFSAFDVRIRFLHDLCCGIRDLYS